MERNPFELFISPDKLNTRQCITAIMQFIVINHKKLPQLIDTYNAMPALDYCNWQLLAKAKYKIKERSYRLKVFDCIPYEGKLRVRIVQNEESGLFIKYETSGDLKEVLEKKYRKRLKEQHDVR